MNGEIHCCMAQTDIVTDETNLTVIRVVFRERAYKSSGYFRQAPGRNPWTCYGLTSVLVGGWGKTPSEKYDESSIKGWWNSQYSWEKFPIFMGKYDEIPNIHGKICQKYAKFMATIHHQAVHHNHPVVMSWDQNHQGGAVLVVNAFRKAYRKPSENVGWMGILADLC